MPKEKVRYVCRECGAASLTWLGRCPVCRAWDSLEAEAVAPPGPAPGREAARPLPLDQARRQPEERLATGLPELDRVLGGGLVRGMVALVGGSRGSASPP